MYLYPGKAKAIIFSTNHVTCTRIHGIATVHMKLLSNTPAAAG